MRPRCRRAPTRRLDVPVLDAVGQEPSRHTQQGEAQPDRDRPRKGRSTPLARQVVVLAEQQPVAGPGETGAGVRDCDQQPYTAVTALIAMPSTAALRTNLPETNSTTNTDSTTSVTQPNSARFGDARLSNDHAEPGATGTPRRPRRSDTVRSTGHRCARSPAAPSS